MKQFLKLCSTDRLCTELWDQLNASFILVTACVRESNSKRASGDWLITLEGCGNHSHQVGNLIVGAMNHQGRFKLSYDTD